MGDVLTLPVDQLPLGQLQQAGNFPLPAAHRHQPGQVDLRQLQRIHAVSGPCSRLPPDDGQEGLAARAVLAFLFLDAEGDDEQDDLRGQGQMVVQGKQGLQVGGGQLFAQPALHLVRQRGEGGGGLQRLGDVGGGVFGSHLRKGLGLRCGELGGLRAGQKFLAHQPVPGGVQPVNGPVQPPGISPAQQMQVQQGSVRVVEGKQAVGGFAAQGEYAVGEQVDGLHDAASFPKKFCNVYHTLKIAARKHKIRSIDKIS